MANQQAETGPVGAESAARAGDGAADDASMAEVARQAREESRRLARKGRERLDAYLAQQRDRLCARMSALADALRKTADALDEKQETVMARYSTRAADNIERLGTGLRDQDIDSFMAQAAEFARRQPALFLGGAVAAGFLLARFLKSSAEREGAWREERHRGGSSGGWSGERGPATGAAGTGFGASTMPYGSGLAAGRSPGAAGDSA